MLPALGGFVLFGYPGPFSSAMGHPIWQLWEGCWEPGSAAGILGLALWG